MTNAIQLSGKKPSGEIYVLGAETVSEFVHNLMDLYGQDAPEVNEILEDFRGVLSPMGRATQAAQQGLGAEPVSAQPAYTPAPPPQYQQPQQQYAPQQDQRQVAGPPPAPQGGGAPHCQHGERAWKTGTNAAGKSWKAWMCPSQQGDPTKCSPQWVK